MTTTPQDVNQAGGSARQQQAARDHLWMHFSRHSSDPSVEIPTIVRGDGVHIWDANGRRYLDGLSGLFVVQVGHGRTELAEAAAKQASELAVFPPWACGPPTAIHPGAAA